MKARGSVTGSGRVASNKLSPSHNNASTPFDDDDDHDEKQWKLLRRSTKSTTWAILRTVIVMVLLTSTASNLYQSYSEQQQQQQQMAGTILAETVQQQQANKLQPSASVPVGGGRNVIIQKGQEVDQDTKNNYMTVDTKLAKTVQNLDGEVRLLKKRQNVFMETDPQGKMVTKMLQDATIELMKHRYGPLQQQQQYNMMFRVEIEVQYPPSLPTYDASTNTGGVIVIELAPMDLIPCSVFYFLEVARTYRSGSFHRNAGHVLQAKANAAGVKQSMPFQEYHPDYPHKKYTAGYAGRPSGPGWYLSIEDNTQNHGPGSQQKHNPHEADSLFGTIVQGIESGVVSTVHSIPQKEWLDESNCFPIPKMTIFVPQEGVGKNQNIGDPITWVPWTPPFPDITYLPVLV